MAIEVIICAVDSKTVASAGTPETLTTRDVRGTSLFILPKSSNKKNSPTFVCDSNDTTKTIAIPSGGLTLPIADPSKILVDVSTNGEGVDWMVI